MPKSPDTDLMRRLIFCGAGILAILVLLAGFRVIRWGFGRSAGDFFYPYLELSRIGGDQVSDLSLLGLSRKELAAGVTALQESNRQLSLQAADAAVLLKENEAIRRNSGLAPRQGWRYVVSEIILRDPLLWQQRFTVNKGSSDGIIAGSAVVDVSPDGRPLLVGIVDEAGKHSSRVITLFDPSLRLSVRVDAVNAIGIANFENVQKSLRSIPVGLLPAHLSYRPGAAVSTTGFEANIPGGISIGTLESVADAGSIYSSELQISGTVLPAADPGALRFPVIIVPSGGGAAR